MSRLRTDFGFQRAILAHDSRDESALSICIHEFHRIDAAERRRNIRRSHLAKEDEQLSVPKRLAGQWMLRSGLDQMRDIPISEPDRLSAIGEESC